MSPDAPTDVPTGAARWPTLVIGGTSVAIDGTLAAATVVGLSPKAAAILGIVQSVVSFVAIAYRVTPVPKAERGFGTG